MRFWIKLVAVLAVVVLAGLDARKRFVGEGKGVRRAGGLDISANLYHRVQAGLFLPDREPLVLDAAKARAKPLLWRTPSGSFELMPTSRGADLRIFMDWEAVSSHHWIRSRDGGYPARIFSPN